MLTLPSAVLDHLTARKPLKVRRLIWVAGANRISGAIETMGLWTGDDHQDFVINGETRTYFGAGNIISIDGLRRSAGLEVRSVNLTLSSISPEVEMMIRGYDVRLAPVEIHRIYFDPETDQTLGTPLRVFKGWIDKIDLKTPPEGQEADCKVTLVSNARAGTKGLTLKKSDGTQRLRKLPGGAEDRFYQYTDIAGDVPVKWGEK